MALLGRLRRRKGTIGQATVLFFALSWLGLAVQPCMAAADATPAVTVAVAAAAESPAATPCHGGEAEEQPSKPHDCPHCADGPAQHCGYGTALGCDAVGVPALPAKSVDLPAPDATLLLLAAPAAVVDAARGLAAAVASRPAPRAQPPPPNLQQRLCRFLK